MIAGTMAAQRREDLPGAMGTPVRLARFHFRWLPEMRDCRIALNHIPDLRKSPAGKRR
ncbi:MAG: hypothetical protein KatS3mg005_3557 [Bryobacteraceae bacterium]|nr:MAG: hypothetical protein KatS3mg005_3557 [Bryobacteraceae bacterium]